MKALLGKFFAKYATRMIAGVIIVFVVMLMIPGVRADINFGQTPSADGGPGLTNLSDKLPDSGEFISDLTQGTKDAIRSPLGTRVLAILKDLGKLFVWALEQMLELFKILLNKL